jgi:hypothetical protein
MSKREYLNEVAPRYRTATLKKKTDILNEFCLTYKCHRKHAIRLLNNHTVIPKPKVKKQGRPPKYKGNRELIKIIETIWLKANLPCSKRLIVILPLWLPFYPQEYGAISPDILKKLQSISPSTLDRILKAVRVRHKLKGRCTTKPGSLLRKHIQIKTNQWDETKPGFIEADTVAHCGTSVQGTFIYTIDAVDIATGWSEQRAVWGRGQTDVLEQIKNIEQSLPFPLLGFDSDNGSEFLNYHFARYCENRKNPIQFTRSRAYHKNDNAHVEQKNWTHVRQWLGYDRLDNPVIVPFLNDLYKNEWRFYHNFFCPSVKLIEKERIGSKTIKKHDSPKTPYQRIMESEYIPYTTKQSLAAIFRSLDPFKLRKAMERRLSNIFKIL